jgi:hypothetical protein
LNYADNRRVYLPHFFIQIAVCNKAFDLEVTVEELEELEASKPAKPLLVMPFLPTPKSSAAKQKEKQGSTLGYIIGVIAASFLFLAVLYKLSLSFNPVLAGVKNSIMEVLLEFKMPNGGEENTAMSGM